jgi:hypothetical protein
MKTKYISILLFILVVAGVALLGSTQVMATCDCDNPVDNSCINIDGYVVRISPENGEWPIECDFSDGAPTLPADRDYCLLEGPEHYLDWRWEACTGSSTNCKKVPTWGYFIMRIEDGISPKILGSYPPGAQLVLPGDPNSCDITTADESHVLWKLNPSVTCEKAKVGDGVKFSMYTEVGLFTGICNISAATLKNYCLGDPLQGPSTTGVIPAEETRNFCYAPGYPNGRIEVTFNRCTGEPETVKIDTNQVFPSPAATICEGEPDDWTSDKCHALTSCGSGAGGCYICTDPPIYVHGEKAYFK